MIATKMTYDEAYNNLSWSNVVTPYFSLREIGRMEREMCRMLEWNLRVDGDALAGFERFVREGFSRDRAQYPSIPLSLTMREGLPGPSSGTGHDTGVIEHRGQSAAASEGSCSGSSSDSPDLYHGGDPNRLVREREDGSHPLRGRMFSIVEPSTF
ncbi:hypothetical protein D9611_010827 [Ephemerocybe angulata]|uniref:Uncharacterized protein n=1 Tax=Ephemerocybe angulata TaxID=980116 RepID=A0A8H5FG34_9AGAR|nr:hypothetical protein D9611_009557 [Tulosesus angulatus]KAF5319120.1 hypothetical protein D9611_014125 [Tulosesus angulatus]KAF5335143.1 hypothetical protein D9611_010827 [Tulosesus angulatus]